MTQADNGGRATHGQPAAEGALGFVDAASSLLRHWKVFAALLMLALLVGVVHYAVTTRDYVAESRFRPVESGADLGRLAGLAAQFGINYALPGEGESIDFYAELLRSRELQEAVVLATYEVPGGRAGPAFRGNFITYHEIEGSTERQIMQRALRRLRKDVGVSTNPKANLVVVRTTARHPGMAEQLNARLLEEVNAFNLERRQSKSAAERRFVEGQLATSRAELQSAEGELEAFLEQNRRVESPQLQFQQARLQQRIDIRQEVHRSLAQAYEKARLDEVRDIPVITVVDSPAGSARRTGSGRTSLLIALLPGLILALSAVFALEHVARARREHPEHFSDLDQVGRRLTARLRSVPATQPTNGTH